MARFSLQDIHEAAGLIDHVFLRTPQYECETLSDEVGARIFVKPETFNPLRSFKGRGADLLIHRAKEKEMMCASAGNFGQAMAYACRKRGIRITVYASESANPFKVERMRRLGATVVLKGSDFDEAKLEAKKKARHEGIRFVEDSLDVETVIGAGTIGLELLEMPDEMDYVLVPLGNGALINGIGMALKSSRSHCKVVGVQSSGAPAMIDSWKAGKVIVHEKISTIADGIGVRIPVVEALKDMTGLVDEGLVVTEQSILNGMKMLQRHIGLAVEPSAAVGIASLIQNPDLFRNKTVMLILTGSNLTEQQLKNWF